ncbi:MAG: hypothetical protein LBS44_05895, partial [Deltaproteobacteria bacterium]|nr:hypothetical protein [Deltaproteobacteria bacterium]
MSTENKLTPREKVTAGQAKAKDGPLSKPANRKRLHENNTVTGLKKAASAVTAQAVQARVAKTSRVKAPIVSAPRETVQPKSAAFREPLGEAMTLNHPDSETD